MFTHSNGYWEVYRHFQGDFLAVGWGLGEGATWKDLPLEEFFTGEEKFHERGAKFPRIIKENNEEIIMKKFFSTESKEKH